MTIDSRVDAAASAELKQLGDIPVDDVLGILDRDVPSYRELYYRWERQQWSAGEIDFSDDHRQWRDTFSPELRRTFLWSLAPFYVGTEQVTNTLVPFVDAAPTEEQQVFLTTQLVDVARHAVFFDRVYSDVLGSEGADMRARVGSQMPQLNGGSRKLLLDLLPGIARLIREDRTNLELLVEGIVLHHIVVESLALTGQRYLLNFTREAGLLPGFRQGFTAVARDGSRHVSFGVAFLKEMVGSDDRYADIVRRKLDELTPLALSVIAPPGNDASYWDPVPYGAEDLATFAANAFDKRVRAIDLPSA